VGIKYVIRLHGGHHFFAEGENRKVKWWKGFQEKKSFSKADAFIAVSEYVQSHTSKYLTFNQKPIEVIYNPVMISNFVGENTDKIKPDRLVFVGTICEKKGIRQLIQAILLVRKSIPEIHLHVYGRDWLFPNGKSYLKWLKDQFDGKELESVTFHGPVEHRLLPQIYEEAELCVFPSHTETLGLVAPEAMVMGKPVIFTKLGPGPEIITHGVDGWLCDPHNPKDIAEKIVDALGERDNFPQVGKKAREKVMKTFNPTLLIKQNVAFYEKIIH
jgi:glycosyltransferase involved in cell wall biosynthesis